MRPRMWLPEEEPEREAILPTGYGQTQKLTGRFALDTASNEVPVPACLFGMLV